MNTTVALALLAPLLSLPIADEARADEARPLETRVTAVTVYADRAQVTRAGRVDLPARPARVLIPQLPGWIDEESVRVTLEPSNAGRILDVSVERVYLAEASEAAVRAAAAAVREIEDQLEVIRDEARVLQAEVAQLEAIRAFSLDKLPRDVMTREVSVATFGQTVDYITSALRDNRAAQRELSHRARALGPELEARTRARDELAAQAQLEHRAVEVELEGKGRAQLLVTYLTPGATWEPVGELRAARGGQEVTLVQYASIVQTTGESWDDAALSFSTQRPADTLGVPEVEALLLGTGGAGLGEVMGRMGASFERAQSSYATQNEAIVRGRAEHQERLRRQRDVEARSRAVFDGLARRGTTAHFVGLSRRPVRADGKSVRIPISTSDFASRRRLVAVPEVSLNAVRTAELVNGGGQPILPGRMALFVDGAFVGHSESPFVSPGEKFAAYLGVHDGVKLERTLDRRRSSIERGRRRTEVTVSYVIRAQNHGAEAIALELGDRVPVAEIDDIDVDRIRIPDGATRDNDGVVRWTATVAPGATASWRVEYRLRYPSDLLVRAREQPSPSPAPVQRQMLFDDIRVYEQSL